MYRRALTINEDLGLKEGVTSAYGNLGLIHQIRGELDQAEQMYRSCQDKLETLGLGEIS